MERQLDREVTSKGRVSYVQKLQFDTPKTGFAGPLRWAEHISDECQEIDYDQRNQKSRESKRVNNALLEQIRALLGSEAWTDRRIRGTALRRVRRREAHPPCNHTPRSFRHCNQVQISCNSFIDFEALYSDVVNKLRFTPEIKSSIQRKCIQRMTSLACETNYQTTISLFYSRTIQYTKQGDMIERVVQFL